MKKKITTTIFIAGISIYFLLNSVFAENNFSSVGMAGSFNNWNPNDPAYQFQNSGNGKWEYTNLFYEGEHKFKFVMNKGWDIHRGVEQNGKLIQPGGDIILKITKTGFYKIVIDFIQDDWSYSEAEQNKPLADIDVEPFYIANEKITLSAGLSKPRPEKKILEYFWSQASADKIKLNNLPVKTELSFLELPPQKPGVYNLKLNVNDGVDGIAKHFKINVKQALFIEGGDLKKIEIFSENNGIYSIVLNIEKAGIKKFAIFESRSRKNKLSPIDNKTIVSPSGEKIIFGKTGKDFKVKFNKPGYAHLIYNSTRSEFSISMTNAFLFQFETKNTEFKKQLPDKTDFIVKRVSIAGSFNNWNPKIDYLKQTPDGNFQLLLPLKDGEYKYKFIVNDRYWISDMNKNIQHDNDGNAIIFSGEKGSDFGAVEEYKINFPAIKHLPDNIDYYNVCANDKIDIRIRILEKDAEKVYIKYSLKKRSFIESGLNKLYTKNGFDYYGIILTKPKNSNILKYYFKINDGNRTAYLNNKGCSEKEPASDYFSAEMKIKFATPDWAKNVIWYQIMTDRFRNGDPSNDPDGVVPPWRWDWFKPFNEKEKNNFYGGGAIWERCFGGDIQGLIESLDYLESIGITGIYLNPMFEAPGHHKYNTADYRHIDDNFGYKGDVVEAQKNEGSDPKKWTYTKTDKLFIEFLKIAHNKGFKVIIDGVFNHSGTEFWAFKDLVKNLQKSEYKDWYVVKDWNIEPAHQGAPAFTYEGWAGFAGLPEYAEDASGLLPGIKKHIFDITKRWLSPLLSKKGNNKSLGVDGWRLDVPNCVAQNFWTDWRKVVKTANPNAYIVGEIWDIAADWLQGEQLDAVMNYEFNKRICAFFYPGGNTQKLKASEFSKSLYDLLLYYPNQVNFVLQNLLSSHDIDRVASAIFNKAGWKKGRVQDENPKYNTNPPDDKTYEILKLITALQMTWVGAPMTYYGDELGMYGADDPTNRMPMWWKDLMPYDNPAYRIREDLLSYYKLLTSIRNTYPALRTGNVKMLAADDENEIIVFERKDSDNKLLVFLNNSDSEKKYELNNVDNGEYVNLIDNRNIEFYKGAVKGIGSKRNLVKIKNSANKINAVDNKLTLKLNAYGAAVLTIVK